MLSKSNLKPSSIINLHILDIKFHIQKAVLYSQVD